MSYPIISVSISFLATSSTRFLTCYPQSTQSFSSLQTVFTLMRHHHPYLNPSHLLTHLAVLHLSSPSSFSLSFLPAMFIEILIQQYQLVKPQLLALLNIHLEVPSQLRLH